MLTKTFSFGTVFLACIFAPMMGSQYLIYENEEGDQQTVAVDEQESITSICKNATNLFGKEPKAITFFLGNETNEQVNVWIWDAWKKQGEVLDSPRVYTHELTQNELEDMRFLITTIAYLPLDDVVLQRRELENALDRLDHIHPLRFMAACIEDLELRNAMHTIREDKWVWKNFFGKVKKTLNTEWKLGNMKKCYVEQFSASLDLDQDIISTFVENKNWDGLADFLYAKYPPIF